MQIYLKCFSDCCGNLVSGSRFFRYPVASTILLAVLIAYTPKKARFLSFSIFTMNAVTSVTYITSAKDPDNSNSVGSFYFFTNFEVFFKTKTCYSAKCRFFQRIIRWCCDGTYSSLRY